MNNTSYAFELQTVQSGAFRILIEALKEILTDANFIFDSSGIKIMAMDSSHTVLVHLKLFNDKFETYYCDNKVTVGIAMMNFYKLIKTMSNNDHLTLFLPKNDLNNLGIRIENSEKNTRTTYFMKLMDLNEETIEIPPAQFDSILTIPSNDFQKIIRDMSNISEIMEIKNVGDELIFSCSGDFASQETRMGPSQGMTFDEEPKEDEIIQGIYALKHLVLFTKCTNLCSSIQLFLKNDYPLIIKYPVANLGEIKLCLAPKVDEN